jgi:type IV pilus assembly protein PilM
MKRDQVARALRPLDEAGIDVDIIQLAPLSIYNFMCFDRLKPDGAYDPANPPPSTVIISVGTDTTDLVITNGYRVWQRSIPIGGNHFTKALTKELKLTFAKAEHLKRNAMKAENPKAVFQAMRPVFSDLVAEIQRSIGFFTSNNRNAKLGDMVALGNPMKLPGLQRFLSQNLDQEVKLLDQFNHLVGGTATAGPQFKENQLTFGVAYGLCVQALDAAQLRTNLLPEEIVTTRLVKAKKPWAVAAVAALLVGLTINYFGHYRSLLSADITPAGQMDQALKAAKSAEEEAKRFASDHEQLKTQFDAIMARGTSLQSNVDGRLLWLEVLKAIDAALPKDTRPFDQKQETEEDIAKRPELHIQSIDCEYFADLTPWQTYIQQWLPKSEPAASETTEDPNATPGEGEAPAGENAAETPPPAETVAEAPPVEAADVAPADGTGGEIDPLTGLPVEGAAAGGLAAGGWVVELKGYHLHNNLPDQNVDVGDEGEQFVQETLIKNLETGKVMLPDGPGGELIEVPIADLGIKYPVVVTHLRTETVTYMAEPIDPNNPTGTPMMGRGYEGPSMPAGAGLPGEQLPKTFKLRQYNFIVQFCWQPQPRGNRLEKMVEQKAAPPAGDAEAPTAAIEPGAAEAGPSS